MRMWEPDDASLVQNDEGGCSMRVSDEDWLQSFVNMETDSKLENDFMMMVNNWSVFREWNDWSL